MRLPIAIRIPFFLVVVLATSSIVSSLSIPRKLDAELALVDLAKRGPAKNDIAHDAANPTAKDPPPRETTPAAKKPPAPSPSSNPPATKSAAITSAAETSAPVTTPASKPSSSAPHSVTSDANVASVPLSNVTSATPTGVNATATGANSTAPVPTGGLSAPAIGGIACLGGVAVVGAAIFAVMRYKRKASLTQNLGTKTNNPYANNSPYGGAAAFPSGANTGYERLSDPQISGAMAPVASSPPQQQQSLGTYTVISTYTPTLGDELEIQPGDKVTLLVEYDDGWCQGVNESRGRVKGVFPKHCVDLGGGQGGDDMERSKRVSSMYGAGGYRM